MATHTESSPQKNVSRDELVSLLNKDLAREYQAIIAYGERNHR